MAQWAHWLNYTTTLGGWHEFDSPTYTAVQTNALYSLYLFCADEGVREAAGKALDVLWHGIAASWFPGGHMLGGPHSRDYDSLFGKGMLNGQLGLVLGFRSKDERQDELYQCEYKDVHCEAIVCPADEFMSAADVDNCRGSGLQGIFAYLNFVSYAPSASGPQGFVVAASAAALANVAEVSVEKRWQEGPAGDYHLYKEEAFAMGVISDDFNINLHGDCVPYPINAQDKVRGGAVLCKFFFFFFFFFFFLKSDCRVSFVYVWIHE